MSHRARCVRQILALVLCLVVQGCGTHRPPATSASVESSPDPQLPLGTASLLGIVKDGQGHPLPGVTVRIEGGQVLGGSRSTTTDARGQYRFPSCPPGTYGLSAQLFGFRTFEMDGLQLHGGQASRFNPVLTVEGVEVGIEVRAHEDIVQAEKSQTSTSLSGFIDNVPPLGRSYQSVSVVTKSNFFDEDVSTADELLVVEASGAVVSANVDGPAGEPMLQARGADGALSDPMPLRRTDVAVEISAFLARTEVTQVYRNDRAAAIEAVYTFPLPTTAAVNDFVMEVRGRRIVGIVRPREEAERIYQEARGRGQTASLLTQERPNVFTQSVANVEPGGDVSVRITYFHVLEYRDGQYEYVFPMTVGPRYIPGNALPRAVDARPGPAGGGVSPDTDQVPDASRITPPSLPPGTRSGHDVGLVARIEAGVPITKIETPSHATIVTRPSNSSAEVRLAAHDTIPNRDFVLRYTLAGKKPQVSIVTHRMPGEDGTFAALVIPPLSPSDADVTPREVTFVVDTSGSMQGIPIDTCRALVRRALQTLRPFDRFNVVRFSGDSGMLAPAPIESTPDNVARGIAYVDALQSSGGTEMLQGIRAYLALPRDPRYVRIVCFLTDGFVGNDDAILGTIANEGKDARWFALGIGSSVNRHLIEGIGHHGRGTSLVVLPRTPAAGERAADALLALIASPVLTDIALDFGSLPVADVEPEQLPPMFAGRPVAVLGRFTAAAEGVVTLRGMAAGRLVEHPVRISLPETARDHSSLAACWARTRIGRLMNENIVAPDPQKQAEITRLATTHHLVSAYTSFVAVDESRVVSDGQPLRILQPVELTEEIAALTAGDRVGRPVQVPPWGVTLEQRRDGSILVTGLGEGGPAVRAGIAAGDTLVAVGGVTLKGLGHLETLLLQLGGGAVEVEVRAAGEERQSRRLMLPLAPGAGVAGLATP